MQNLHQNNQLWLACSSEMDDGDDDSDSEPILGKWFAETLFPPGDFCFKTSQTKSLAITCRITCNNETNPVSEGDAIAKETSDSREETANRKRGTGDQGVVLLVPQRGEASGFVRLTAKIFHLLNQYFTNCRTKYLSSYFRDGVDSEQVIMQNLLALNLTCFTMLFFKPSFRCVFWPEWLID